MKLLIFLLTFLFSSIALGQTVRNKDNAVANKVLGKSNVTMAQAQRTNKYSIVVSGTGWTTDTDTTYAYAYSDAKGNWFMFYNIEGTASGAGTNNLYSISVEGIVVKTLTHCWGTRDTEYRVGNTIMFRWTNGSNSGIWITPLESTDGTYFSQGVVELSSKPDWADANLIGR